MQRSRTWIPGFDQIIEGGFPVGSLILLVGESGTGKTVFATNILYNELLHGGKGILILTEEYIEKFIRNMKSSFNWDLEYYVKKNKLKIFTGLRKEITAEIGYADLFTLDFRTLYSIFDQGISEGYQYFILDSVYLLTLFFSDPAEFRKAVLVLYKMISQSNSIAIFTMNPNINSEHKVLLEHLSDGIIELYQEVNYHKIERKLVIKKMLATSHSRGVHKFEIKRGKGIYVYR